MKLLIATPLYPPQPGGPATYTRLLEQGLPAMGHEVGVLKFSDVARYPKIVRHALYFYRVFRAARGADLVLALDAVSTGLPAAFATLLAKRPFVVRIPGDHAWEQGKQRFDIQENLDDFVRTGRVPFFVAVMRAAQNFVAHHARLVIVPSHYLKGIVMAWGIPEGKIIVIHNAVTEPVPGAVPEAIEALGRPRIVTSARLVPWKGVHGLIDAVAMLRTSFPNASLAVVGDGPDRVQLETYARTRLGENYAFTGGLPHEEAFAALTKADAFVLNSSYEGLSHVLIEALYAGVPIVASQAGGNGEVVIDGESGLLVPVGDTDALVGALERIGSDKDLRARLVAGARARTQEFALSTMLERTAAVLSGTLAA